jgi:hypothetical protein
METLVVASPSAPSVVAAVVPALLPMSSSVSVVVALIVIPLIVPLVVSLNRGPNVASASVLILATGVSLV